MKRIFKKKNAALTNKLKGAIAEISIDVFGYEKKISHNIINHTRNIATWENVLSERLYLRISQEEHKVISNLYDQDQHIKSVPTDELAFFFLEEGIAVLPNVRNKIAFSIKKYLKEFATANQICEQDVQIWLNVKQDVVTVKAFHNKTYIKEISLLSLIKYFK
ncbi:hypothetical protein LX97_00479 [Nonlabens dokdonensis]|uniref:Uncharacterized protein n=2 Tax=Nonlabens dokdonensis TaxID=328515 RepID=L7W2V5_NONDD|nr:hypothetical protein [Nonlabens dokdonensis]AGC75795.1 hypothetical protein DDD_0668 [Nonlabens dokdonensis DSW-6]PZX43478.1 hypothetical protein LX97_00479 [Nonlabens dokdonensis]